MKPVNLLPKGAAVVATQGQKSNAGMLGGIAVGVVALLGIGGYFAMSRVDSIKSETSQAISAQTEATTQIASVRQQIATVGQPVNDSDTKLADGAEKVLVGAYAQRYDYVQLARELKNIMAGTDGWYTKVDVNSDTTSDAASADGAAVTLEGFMPTVELAAGFAKRVTATHSLSGAEGTAFSKQRLLSVVTKKPGAYYHFTVTATFDDNVAPSADGSGSTSATGTTVADGAANSLKLSLDPEPVPVQSPAQIAAARAKARAAAQPKNPFDVAAQSAAGGGS
ncbi:MAG: hypothetical protein JWN41_1058 [Thermoleophilia bacterium]|nr:hypothetical protein [Thermoleophilia bacterium]